MIIKRLVVTNLYDNTFKTYDIQAVTPKISSLLTQDIQIFKDNLTAAFFGRDEALAPMAGGYATETNFTLAGVDYMLTRSFRDNGDEAQLLLEGEDTIVCKDIDEVSEFIDTHFAISKYTFKKLLELDMESAEGAFLQSGELREEYIASLYQNLVGNLDALYAQADKLEKQADELAIKIKMQPHASLQDAEVLAKEVVVLDNHILHKKAELALVRGEIVKAEDYLSAQEKHESLLYLQKQIAARSREIDKMDITLDDSNEALMLSGLYQRKEEIGADITVAEREIAKLEKEIATLRAKIEKGNKAQKASEQDFAMLEERSQELNKLMQDIILKGAKDPLSLDINDDVENYYSNFNQELGVLRQKKEEIDKLYNQICTESAVLEDRKKEIVLPARVKKAIAEGSLFEEFIDNQTLLLANAQTELEQLRRNLVTSKEELGEKAKAIDVLNAQIQEQEGKIKGAFPTLEEAVNNDILVKQTLYANHILIASHENEVAAIDNKIQRLEVDKGDYMAKLRLLKEALEDLEEHKAKCIEKRQDFVDRKISILGENKFADIIDGIEYGDQCPICNNFITEKKQGNKLDYSGIEAEIVVFDRLIEEDEEKMREVLNTVGKYETALRVNAKYMESLQETKEVKISAVADIYTQCGVTSGQELEKALRTSIEKSNKLRFDVEKLTAEKEKLTIMVRFMEKEQDAAKNLEKVSIKEKEKEIADIKKTLEKARKEYGKFEEDLKGEKASSLLQKLNIVEKEWETLENELAIKLAQKAEIFKEKQELEQAILILSNKAVLVELKGANYGYQEIVSKAISDKLAEIVIAIRKNDMQKEDVKLKVAAIRKILHRQAMELDELYTQLDIQKSKKEVLGQTLDSLKQNYEERFAALGITSQVDLYKLILPREQAIQYAISIRSYDEEKARNEQALADTVAMIDALGEFFLRYEDNLAKEADLAESIDKDIFALATIANKRQDILDNLELQKQLAQEQELLDKQLTDLASLLEAIPSDIEKAGASLSKFIVKSAASLMWEYTQGSYTLSYKDGTIGLVNLAKNKTVKPTNISGSEKSLMAFIVAVAVRQAFDKLSLAHITLPALITLQEGEASALLGKAFARCAEYHNLIINQEDLSILKPLMKHAS